MEILLDLASSKEKKFFEGVLDKYLLELGILEDAYITARYIIRAFSQKEALRLLKVVEEIIQKWPTKVLIQRGLERQKIFRNLEKYLSIIKTVIKQLDSTAIIYLFGSVAEKTHTYRSDIDILIITNQEPAIIHKALWNAGIKEPFEIHIHTSEYAPVFTNRSTMIEI